MQCKQVGNVPVFVADIVAVLGPFHQLTPRSDPRLEQPLAQPADRGSELGIDIQQLGGFDVIGEQIPDNLLVVSDAGSSGPCSGDQPSGVTSAPSGRASR